MHRRRDIDRCLAGSLSPRAEAGLRAHLRACAQCRAYYDAEVGLLRALAGQPEAPTGVEQQRFIGRVLRAAGVPPAAPPKPTWVDWIVDSPGRSMALALAVLLLLIGGILVRRPAAVRPRGAPAPAPAPVLALVPASAGRLVVATNVSVDGRPAAADTTLAAGAQVAVARNGIAEIAVERGGRVRLFPGAAVALSARGEVVELAAGKVWCEVNHDRGQFAVRTDSAEARVLGTSFVVDKTQDGDTDVRVVSGTVEVEDREHHGTVRVKGGHRTHVAARGAPSEPRRYDVFGDRNEWTRIFNEIGRAIERTFKAVGDAFK